LASHIVRKPRHASRMRRRAAARKARDGEVERAPEQMYGRDLAEKAGAELPEHPLDLAKGSVKPLNCLPIIWARCMIFGEGCRIRDFVRRAVDVHASAETVDQRSRPFEEIGRAHRFQ